MSDTFRFIVVNDQIVPCNNRAEVFAAGDVLAAAGLESADAHINHMAGGAVCGGVSPDHRSPKVYATAEAPDSVGWTPSAIDRRCRHWHKVIRAGAPLPTPSSVSGANDTPGAYLRDGDEIEIYEGDFVVWGEENHHTKKRGWQYGILALYRGGKSGRWGVHAVTFSETKDKIRANTSMDKAEKKALLAGAGDVAAMIRHIHAVRQGLI